MRQIYEVKFRSIYMNSESIYKKNINFRWGSWISLSGTSLCSKLYDIFNWRVVSIQIWCYKMESHLYWRLSCICRSRSRSRSRSRDFNFSIDIAFLVCALGCLARLAPADLVLALKVDFPRQQWIEASETAPFPFFVAHRAFDRLSAWWGSPPYFLQREERQRMLGEEHIPYDGRA
jgi:hypothetical protein